MYRWSNNIEGPVTRLEMSLLWAVPFSFEEYGISNYLS
jgi:hypothetical protein